MKLKSVLFTIGLLAALSAPTDLLSQCDEGQTPIEFVIDTDAWGYEMYWELTPTGLGCGRIFSQRWKFRGCGLRWCGC